MLVRRLAVDLSVAGVLGLELLKGQRGENGAVRGGGGRERKRVRVRQPAKFNKTNG
jgi:hypothetical protein